eukprot:566197-Pelagomonas_calceolata.AAC.2
MVSVQAKLTEELKATSSYQASLKLEQRKITDVFQQYSQESQVWASRSEQAHMALHQRCVTSKRDGR